MFRPAVPSFRKAPPKGGGRARGRALVAAALAAPLLLAGPASGAGERGGGETRSGRFTVTPLTFTVTAGERRCTVDADLYRPRGVDRAHPAPAVLATNGFGGSKDDASTAAIGRIVAERGYVGLVYSGLGFGRSGCLISLDDPAIDGRAASGLLDFLAGERAADDGTRADYVVADAPGDPRVGMLGASYGGAVQLATAADDHRVDALVPMITWHDLAYSLAPNNAVDRTAGGREVPGAAKWQWMNGFYLAGEGQPLLAPSLDPSRINSLDCLHFVTRACEMVRTLNSGRYPADRTRRLLAFARSVSPVSYLDRVEAPTLLVQGQADTLFNLNEAEATYRTLKEHGTTAKMIWQSWGHSGGTGSPAAGELDLGGGDLESSYVGRRILAWFDRYLRHDESAETGPDFAYHRDWIKDPDRAYATASRLPADRRELYLSGEGRLVDDPARVTSGSRTYRNGPLPTSHSESRAAGLAGLPDPAPYDTRGTHLGWTTEPLTRSVEVVGAPEATLRVDSPRAERAQRSADAADKLVLFAKLYDVAPGGEQTLVHRLVAPVRVPDVRGPFTVRLPGIVHRYEKGHRLRFVIAASDGAYGGNRGVKPVTVTSAPGDTGVLRLPVVQSVSHGPDRT
ncbi:putative CocE/NonD family hydrolase [Streptomyces spectabilis]|uniref:Putative CocE/NonD family hydrolase n=1 Tax=Streptomyces spectabilis TaxID=68270 RepID=A0A7W8EVL1_STRST|nr:putative CocE/NonD family hydrolase [Streptomyces spectabilis]